MESLLDDPCVVLAGYQPYFEDLVSGLFLFTHAIEGCNTSMAIPVKKFVSLTDRPILNTRMREPDGCPHLCMHEEFSDHCPVKCECNWVRDVLSKINSWS